MSTVGQKYYTYTVKPGDTLSAISTKYKTSVDAIQSVEENCITNANSIEVGQPIYIPIATTTYTVKKGDTAYGIARRFGCTLEELKACNAKLVARDPGLNQLEIGDVIELPAKQNLESLCDAAPKTIANGTSRLMSGSAFHYTDQIWAQPDPAEEAEINYTPVEQPNEEDWILPSGDDAAPAVASKSTTGADDEEFEFVGPEQGPVGAVEPELVENAGFQQTYFSSTDPDYFTNVMQYLVDSNFYGYNPADIKARPGVREAVSTELGLCCNDDDSFLIFLDTLLDAGIDTPQDLLECSRKTDVIFGALRQAPGFKAAMAGSDKQKVEFVFGFFRRRLGEQKDRPHFGGATTHLFVEGLENLKKLAVGTTQDAKSVGYCSVCAQHIGILLERMDVGVTYHYGQVDETSQIVGRDRVADRRYEATPPTTPTAKPGELHMWIEAGGIEWEPTTLTTRAEIDNKTYYDYSDQYFDPSSSSMYSNRINYTYPRVDYATSPPLESAIALEERAYDVLTNHRVDEYHEVCLAIRAAINEDPGLLPLYQAVAELELRLAKNEATGSPVQLVYLRASCQHFDQAIKLADPTRKDVYAQEALVPAMLLAAVAHESREPWVQILMQTMVDQHVSNGAFYEGVDNGMKAVSSNPQLALRSYRVNACNALFAAAQQANGFTENHWHPVYDVLSGAYASFGSQAKDYNVDQLYYAKEHAGSVGDHPVIQISQS